MEVTNASFLRSSGPRIEKEVCGRAAPAAANEATPMNEALELCKLCDERTLGLILALLRRTQGSSAASVITNLQASSEAGSSLARNTLAAFEAADSALQQMADAEKVSRLHAGPGGRVRSG
jgi:hypothetical protein